jgi:hypothetical protein
MGVPFGMVMSIGVSSMYTQDKASLEASPSKAAVYNVGERHQHTMIVGNPGNLTVFILYAMIRGDDHGGD